MARLLVEDADQEYDVSQEDLHIYAEQIGINVKNEKHLMWIAEKGLAARVPKPWLILCDEKERVYYYNPKTKELSWHHPLDKEYASLVSEERSKSKSLNSASSDYGFESKLSSLADAPPLSSGGKNSPLSLSREKNDGGLSGRKMEFGRIENRRGTHLAPPVRLNALKMPPASTPKASSGMSFMPKGATLSKNIRRVKADENYGNKVEDDYGQPHLDDSNESNNSDEGSKYSYEETDEEEKNNQRTFGLLDASQLSPMHSADESPDALEINSLVQLGTKSPQRLGSSLKREQLENVINKENSPSLGLRKVGQPSFLKPLSQVTKKKASNKGSKGKKKAMKMKYSDENEDYDDKIPARIDDQRVMLEEIQKEWLAMQDDLEKHEKEKYEDMVKDSSKKLEEEEMKLRNENSEKISKIKMELQKNIEEEERAAEKSLQILKDTNKNKINEEEEKLKKELENVSESLKNEIKKIQEKNAAELAEKKKELEIVFKKEIENLKIVHDSNIKNIAEAHAAEISNIQNAHEKEIMETESSHKKEVDGLKIKASDSEPKQSYSEEQKELENLKALIKAEKENYEKLLKEKENILTEISSKKEYLEKTKSEAEELQTGIAELQDEIEKNENDLDLLRSEKSGLISELNILKENINNEKSNLSNLEKKVKTAFQEASCSKQLSEAAVNTTIFDTVSQAIQVSVMCVNVSSQVEKTAIPMSDAVCQTAILQNHSTISCQTDTVSLTNRTNVEASHAKSELSSNHIDKNLESALSGLGMKIDSRISVIENQLRSLQENISKQSANESYSNQEVNQNHIPEVNTSAEAGNKYLPPVYSTDSSVPPGLFPSHFPISSQNKCQCEYGDPASCSVLQDVKNSVYQLNSILCASFSPSTSASHFYQAVPPINNYSSPFDSFYSQVRNMQEKHRLTELKHKCENEAVKLSKGISSNKTDTNVSESFSHNENLKPTNHWMHSNLYSYNVSDDPLIRARSIVLREQARNWKEQQQLNSQVPHIFSLNSSLESSKSSISGYATAQNVPLSQQSFLNFDVDPETDYNMWMTRLNALQLRIRSHKMI